jgi:hypothetical protein
VHRAGLRRQDVVLIENVPVTSAARTCVDVARDRSLLCGVVLLDAALHAAATSVEEIEDVLRSCWNWPKIRRAQRALALADARSESPLETISRLVIPRLGFPAPEPQRWIFDTAGRPIARSDFYWDAVGVVGEADGRGKYSAPEAFVLEKDRQDALEDLGLIVVRWGWTAAWNRHDVLRRKIAGAFERGVRRDRSGFPRQWSL